MLLLSAYFLVDSISIVNLNFSIKIKQFKRLRHLQNEKYKYSCNQSVIILMSLNYLYPLKLHLFKFSRETAENKKKTKKNHIASLKHHSE